MSYWQALNQSITSAIESGKIGKPVFVRLTALTASENVSVDLLLDFLYRMAAGWMSQCSGNVYGLKGKNDGQLTATAQFAEGASAVITAACDHGVPRIDLIVLGNHGAIYHSEQIVPARDGSIEIEPTPGDQTLREAIAKSIESGTPVKLDGGEAK